VLWYFWNLLDNQLYLIPFLLFVAGMVFVFRRNESATKNFYPVLLIAGTYVGFTLLKNKDFRFTMPMLPAVAVVAVHWFEYLKARIRRWLIGGVVVYSVVAFLAVSFGTRLLPKDLIIHLKPRALTSDLIAFMPGYEIEATRVQGLTIFAQHGWLVGPPSDEKWYHEAVFTEIAARNGTSFWYAGGDSIWFNTWGTRYYALKYGAAWVASPQEAEYLIVRGSAAPGLTNGFVRLKEYALPDAEPLRLYARV
jgi:hypothetical protein